MDLLKDLLVEVVSYIWYSSQATCYPHVCCRLKILGWRLHHVFNIWTSAHYIRARIRQIIRYVHLRTLHSFWMNLLMKFNLNSIYRMKWWILSLYVPIDPWIDCPTEKLLTNLILIVYTGWTDKYCHCMFQSILESTVLLKSCSRAVACSISYPTVWFGEWIWHREWILHWWLHLH